MLSLHDKLKYIYVYDLQITTQWGWDIKYDFLNVAHLISTFCVLYS